ncbi:MAG: DNA polymerase III subunit delta [Sphingomonadaceae bacterium]
MIAKRPAIERALDSGSKDCRLILLYGPDEAGSRALADRLGKAMGADAERIDFTGAAIKADPALLADEVGAISLFGGARYIRIEPAGDEIAAAVESLAASEIEGNPVVVVGGALRKDSKLVKAASADPKMLAFASYVPEGAEADRIAGSLAREAGLTIAPDIARRLALACNGDRAILAREIEKLALFADAAPDRLREVGQDTLDALGAAVQEGDMGRLVDAVLEGRLDAIEAALAELAADGIEGIPLIRALLRRLLQLGQYRSEMHGTRGVSDVMASAGKSLFWKDKEAVQRQLQRWEPDKIDTAISRLIGVERAIKTSGSAGAILLDEELFAIGRAAQRMR